MDANYVKHEIHRIFHAERDEDSGGRPEWPHSGDFIQRLHDILYDPGRKLGYFGRFCALECYGTIKPADCRQ